MKNFYKNEESGRSMVEMLGVLAIIGVLSIGGISGYSKAMGKYRINKTLDQISMLVMNIRSMYSANVNYKGLEPNIALQMGIIPTDMLLPGNTVSKASKIYNVYQGEIGLAAAGDNNQQFMVSYAGLPRDACVTIATADWGSQAGSGLLKLKIGKSGSGKTVSGSTGTEKKVDELPLSLVDATILCANDKDDGNTVVWTYY